MILHEKVNDKTTDNLKRCPETRHVPYFTHACLGTLHVIYDTCHLCMLGQHNMTYQSMFTRDRSNNHILAIDKLLRMRCT